MVDLCVEFITRYVSSKYTVTDESRLHEYVIHIGLGFIDLYMGMDKGIYRSKSLSPQIFSTIFSYLIWYVYFICMNSLANI